MAPCTPMKIILTRKQKNGQSQKWCFRRNYAFKRAFWREFHFNTETENVGQVGHHAKELVMRLSYLLDL